MTSLLARTAMIGVCLWGGLTLQSWAQGPQERTEPPRKFRLATPGQPVAGIPYEEAIKIGERHTEELRQLPGVVSVGFSAEGLVVETARPEALPASVEGLPVFAVPPVDPRAAMGLEEGIPLPSPAAPQPVPPPVVEEPPLADCPAGMHREPGEVRCRFDTPPAVVEPKVKLIPPPPGVVVLRPGKVREQAESCPQGFEEVEGYNNWRFCVDPQKPEPLPNLWSPPIAGIPYEKALEIHYRHVYELSDLPGVEGVGLGAEGINVYTTNPELVPKQIEGLQIIIHPVPEGETAGQSHV